MREQLHAKKEELRVLQSATANQPPSWRENAKADRKEAEQGDTARHSADYDVDIVAQFHRDLARAAAAVASFEPSAKPLWIFLDGIHDLDDDRELPHLQWLPTALPPGCRLIISTCRGALSSEAERHLTGCPRLTWKPANEAEVKYMTDQWLLSARRKMTTAQEATLESVWSATSSPLCVRLTVHDGLRWSSFEDPLAALSSQDIQAVDEVRVPSDHYRICCTALAL